jgi:hypothetical protein
VLVTPRSSLRSAIWRDEAAVEAWRERWGPIEGRETAMSTDTHSWTDTGDRQLARSIFGTDEWDVAAEMIANRMVEQGFEPGHIRSIELSVGAGVTIDLPGRSPIFVKVWPKETDRQGLSAQLAVQRAMAADGYPAPAVLTDLSALGPAAAVAMSYNRDGDATDARTHVVCQRMAQGLARFITMADSLRDTPGLPWRRLPDGTVWPPPHNALFDFEATRKGAEWIDRIAKDALAVMRSAGSHIIVGHHDWSAKNMRMGLDGIAVLYDWDAVFLVASHLYWVSRSTFSGDVGIAAARNADEGTDGGVRRGLHSSARNRLEPS